MALRARKWPAVFAPRQARKGMSLVSADIAQRAPIGKQTRQLELLALRSFQLADRVASGELQFLDAVDLAFDVAVASGLADAVGYEVIQTVLTTAFEKVRP
jgi:hypothetical protein